MIDISIIMSVYNDENYLEESINSILNQTFTNWECIIINDASKDRSSEIIEHYSAIEPRIKVINLPVNQGLANALNMGIKNANGTYIARHDSDDIMLPDRLSKQFDFMETHKEIGVLGSFAKIIDEDGVLKGSIITPRIPNSNNICKGNPVIHPSVFIRKELFNQIGSYDSSLRRCQDYALWFHFISRGVNFYNLEEELLLYRITRSSYSKKKFRYRWSEAQIIWKGCRKLNKKFTGLVYAIKPILVGVLPKDIYRHIQFKKSFSKSHS
ncbi:glycosyltransferase family 2 protein [Paenibacillus lutrae]|uniref:Glycosyltransferase n=1 Tax=Paenibacillus lutrae TaxID=2078573 RepID=A0A7X3FFC1_9BACL|nr:glycosyltransferase [Paenibacillus lutrae]MVO98684.1 glycosyltransferase [Paenibacillus lutrae]